MLKKMVLLSVLGVSLTGCIIAPFDEGYDRRGDRGGYDSKHDRHDHRGDDRRDDRRGDRPDWNWNSR